MVWDFNSVALGYGGALIAAGVAIALVVIYDNAIPGKKWIAPDGNFAFSLIGAVIGMLGVIIAICAIRQVF